MAENSPAAREVLGSLFANEELAFYVSWQLDAGSVVRLLEEAGDLRGLRFCRDVLYAPPWRWDEGPAGWDVEVAKNLLAEYRKHDEAAARMAAGDLAEGELLSAVKGWLSERIARMEEGKESVRD